MVVTPATMPEQLRSRHDAEIWDYAGFMEGVRVQVPAYSVATPASDGEMVERQHYRSAAAVGSYMLGGARHIVTRTLDAEQNPTGQRRDFNVRALLKQTDFLYVEEWQQQLCLPDMPAGELAPITSAPLLPQEPAPSVPHPQLFSL